MSFVVGLATVNYGIVISDGRACRNDSILTEHFNKTRKIGNVIIGFSGEAELGVEALENIKPNNNASATEIAELLCEYLRNKKLPSSRKCNFVIVGPNTSNQMEVYYFGISNGLKIDIKTPDAQNIQFVALSSDAIPNPTRLVVQRFNYPAASIKKGLEDVIHLAAELDSSVNKNCFVQEISLS